MFRETEKGISREGETMIVGIDVGLKGAIFLTDSCNDDQLNTPAIDHIPFIGNRLDSHKFKMLLVLYLRYDCKHIFIEEPTPMPKQSVQSTATTFENYGRMMALIETSGIEFTPVKPKDWTKVMFAGMAKPDKPKDKKIRSLKRAWQLYPNCHELIKTDGEADAALIAYYGTQLLKV
jgi:hypothetical protein